MPNLDINYSSVNKNIKDDIAYLLDCIKEKTESNKDISKCLLESSFMLDDIVNYYCQRIYNYSFVQAGKYVDVNSVYIKLNNSNKFKEASVDDFTLTSMFDSAYDNCVLTYDKSEVR